jgi:hypothetical protein
VLLVEASEISHLLLQHGDLGLQGAKLFGQRQQRSRKLRHLAEVECRWHLGEGSQAALMQAGQQVQVLTAYPFFAAIVRMALQGKLRICQPAVQRFGIDAQATSSLGQRHKGHGTTPFVWCVQQERE